MKVNNSNQISFKGYYQIKGSTELLDEICWFLQRQKKSKPNFDFLDIRLTKSAESQTKKLLGSNQFSKEKISNKLDEITEHILDLISIRKGNMQPFKQPNVQNLDLFLTNKDKTIAASNARVIVEDSVVNSLRGIHLGDKARLLLDNLSKMRNNLSKGKPIINIKEQSLRKYLPHLMFEDIPVLQAEKVLDSIKKGSFNIIEGNISK